MKLLQARELADTKKQIQDYLDLLKMKYTWNEEVGVFELVFTERKDDMPASPELAEDDMTFRYTVAVRPGERWVQVYCDVYPIDKIPENTREDVLIHLLACNRKYAEVCFDYDENRGVIGTSQEMLVQGLNFDAFRDEFFAVPWAVKKFWTEVAKEHGLK